jgi:hypothetical protein
MKEDYYHPGHANIGSSAIFFTCPSIQVDLYLNAGERDMVAKITSGFCVHVLTVKKAT